MTTLSPLHTLPMITAAADDLSVGAEIQVVQEVTIVASIPAQSTAASRHVMGLLADRVPLSLLCDLADPSGPASADIVSSEDARSVLGDLLTFRAAAAEGGGRAAKARVALRNLRLG